MKGDEVPVTPMLAKTFLAEIGKQADRAEEAKQAFQFTDSYSVQLALDIIEWNEKLGQMAEQIAADA